MSGSGWTRSVRQENGHSQELTPTAGDSHVGTVLEAKIIVANKALTFRSEVFLVTNILERRDRRRLRRSSTIQVINVAIEKPIAELGGKSLAGILFAHAFPGGAGILAEVVRDGPLGVRQVCFGRQVVEGSAPGENREQASHPRDRLPHHIHLNIKGRFGVDRPKAPGAFTGWVKFRIYASCATGIVWQSYPRGRGGAD